MFTELAIDVDSSTNPPAFPQQRLYLSGETLMAWVNEVSDDVRAKGEKSAPAKTGDSPDTAIPLAGCDSWIGAWPFLRSKKNQHVYFEIAGRVIHKFANGSAQDGFADGFYVADHVLSGTDTYRTEDKPGKPGKVLPKDGTIWARKHGASYRDFGNFMHKKDSESAMEGVVWSQRTASKLRMVLKGTTGGHAPQAMRVDTDHKPATGNDTEAALPLLGAAMFLAEPARNSRAWVIGLMMLDLLGDDYVAPRIEGPKGEYKLRNGKFYTLQRVLVHPSRLIDPAKYGQKNYPKDPEWQDELNEATDRAPSAWVDKQAKGKDRSAGPKMKETGSAAVEGLYPPSPKWSGRSADRVDVANDYIQQKELSVLCRWLQREFNAYIGSVVSATALTSGSRGTRKDVMTTDFTGNSAMKGFKSDLERIIKTELMARRANSFDTPGMLFR